MLVEIQGKQNLTEYSFKCKDIGMKNCNFEIKGSSSKEEVMQIAAVHAKQAHEIDPIPPDLGQKVGSAIRS